MALRFYDISPPLSPQIAVFPGDQPFEVRKNLEFERGDALKLSSILTTVHLGAHADGPNHYHPRGVGIDQRDLNLYLGLAQVIGLKNPADTASLTQHKILAPRALFRTQTFENPDEWREDFASLSASSVDYLHQEGVRLVGIDTPSIDSSDSKVLPSHNRIFEHDMAILEGLTLTKVPEGLYILVALPLRLVGMDASPVRAILVEMGQAWEAPFNT